MHDHFFQKFRGVQFFICSSIGTSECPGNGMVSKEMAYRTEIISSRKAIGCSSIATMFVSRRSTSTTTRLHDTPAILLSRNVPALRWEGAEPLLSSEGSRYLQGASRANVRGHLEEVGGQLALVLRGHEKEWKAAPSKFHGMPRPPKYKERNGRFTAFFTTSNAR